MHQATLTLYDGDAFVRELRDRRVLQLSTANTRHYSAGDAVVVRVTTKNVGQELLVRVFRINAGAYYRANGREVEDSIVLDGYTPHSLFTVKIAGENNSKFLQSSCSVNVDAEARGVYVVELLAGGLKCRAVIRKGALRVVQEPHPDGQLATLLDETGAAARGSLWLAGQTYATDDKGTVLIPYRTANHAETCAVVLTSADGSFASLASFTHEPEQYQFAAAFFVAREELLAKSSARLLIRSRLTLHGQLVSLAQVKKVALEIQSVDREGITTVRNVDTVVLCDNEEAVHVFAGNFLLRRWHLEPAVACFFFLI